MVETSNNRFELRRMKVLATALFWFFTLVFIVTSIYEKQYGWVGFIRASAEAAMIGAIADWFAVTALFRHPLGLKIPHTAIIPTRKDSIAVDFASFVKSNFLSSEVVVDKLRSVNVARGVAHWLSRPENSKLLADYVAVGLAGAVQVIKDEDVQALIEHNVAERIQTIRFAPHMGNVLSVILSGDRQKELLYGMVKLAANLLEENREAIKEQIARETPWWLPESVDNAIYQKIVDAVGKTLNEVSADTGHPLHGKFNEIISRFIGDLKHSPDILAKETALKAEFLQDSAVREFSASLWADIKNSLIERSANPKSYGQTPIQQGLTRLGEALLLDETMLKKIDQWIEEAAAYLVEAYGYEVEHLISQTIVRWDAEEASRKIELHVGKDLQFIRINGTLVGGLVGLIIHTLALLFL